MHADRYGYALSTHSASATAAYCRGIRAILETRLGAQQELMEAIRLDPELAIAYVAMANLAASPSEAAALRSRGLELAASTSRREQRHVQVIAGLATRRPGILEDATAYLDEFPRDALVLEHTLRYMFFFGGAGRESAALKLVAACAPAYPQDDWFAPARHAFFLQELRQYIPAERLARLAIERNPENGNAIHALAHVLHGLGAHHDAHEVLSSALARYQGFFRSHFYWHTAIVELALAEGDPLAAFDAHLVPSRSTGPVHLALADAVGYLISCKVLGIDAADQWRSLSALVAQLAASPGHPFIDAHVAAVLAVLDDRPALDELRARLARCDAEPARWSRPIVDAIASRSPERLFALDDATREAMGGSRVERELLDELAVVFDRAADVRARFRTRRPIHPVLARVVAPAP
jgi:hypothetical protein